VTALRAHIRVAGPSLALALAAAAALSGCRGLPSENEPIVPIRNMYDQPRYENQGRSRFFADGRMMRPKVEGTVAREQEVDPVIEHGREPATGQWVLTIPDEVARRYGGAEAMTRRGHERYDIYCAPCHGGAGDGNGIIVARGMLRPPTYHQDRIRHMPDGQLYATITNGIRSMPGYYAQIPTDDRWAIVAYVRALQISQANVPQENAQ
jgi:mono/diheme cytochrome c family protein